MRIKKLPDKQFLNECFSYCGDSGNLFWKERPRHHFKTESIMKTINTRFAGKVVGTKNSLGYLIVNITQDSTSSLYLVHRLIAHMFIGDCENKLIDHIDNDTLNNRIENLRICSSSENLGNMGKTKRDGLQGAFYMEDRGYWKACIKINYKQIILGNFATEQEAHDAYVKAKIERNSKF